MTSVGYQTSNGSSLNNILDPTTIISHYYGFQTYIQSSNGFSYRKQPLRYQRRCSMNCRCEDVQNYGRFEVEQVCKKVRVIYIAEIPIKNLFQWMKDWWI